ncbi:hypothetical protein JCM1841_001086 [Sporobolomyces salmonicolor]
MLRSLLLRTARSTPLARATPARLFATSSPRPIAASPRLFDSSSSASTPAPSLTEGEQVLKDKLAQGLEGAKIDVQDVSGGCGTFYAISIAHESFKGLSTIKQHRIVNELLKDDIKGMHGLQLKTTAP